MPELPHLPPRTVPYTDTILPGTTHYYKVQCTPANAGLREADLVLNTNVVSQPTLTYHLTCEGVMAGYSSTPAPPVAPAKLDLGSADVGTFATDQVINITETSNIAALEISATTSGSHKDDFFISNPVTFPYIINAGGTDSVTVRCKPSAKGTRKATLTLTTNDPANNPASYPLTCNGLAPTYDSVPVPSSTMDFGASQSGISVTKTLKITVIKS